MALTASNTAVCTIAIIRLVDGVGILAAAAMSPAVVFHSVTTSAEVACPVSTKLHNTSEPSRAFTLIPLV
jgi:hypothetical protein